MLVPFAPPPGINSDDTTFSAEGQWADASNVRFRNGRWQAIGGWARSTMPATTGICRAMLVYSNPLSAAPRTIFGTTTRLQVSPNDGAIYNVTPAGFTSGSTVMWSLDIFGEVLLGAPVGQTLYRWDGNTASVATEITQAPDQIYGGIISTDQRQVLALGCTQENATLNRMCIRGCDLEDVTDWTSSVTNNAFEHILDGEGMIVGGCKIGPYIAVWTNNALYIGQYIGDPSQTYKFDLVAYGCGLVGINAKTIVNGTAYWVSTDLTIWSWSPGSPPQVVPCPILKDFRDNCNRAVPYVNRIVASTVRIFGEVWFFYPRAASEECSHYIALCLDESAKAQRPVWFKGDIARGAWIDDPQVALFDSINSSSITAIDTAGATWFHEYGNVAGVDARNWHIQSADQYLDDSTTEVEIQKVIPDFEDQVGDVSLTVYARDRPQRSATTKGPYTLATTTTKKDLRVSGKIFAVKLSGGAITGSYARGGKPLFEIKRKGQRP